MSQIKELVTQLVKTYDTYNPFEIAELMGVVILFEPLGNVWGYYNKQFRIPMIHINQDLPERSQYFTCAHELGHVVQHPDVNTSFLKKHTLFSMDKFETEANTFAIELLLPDKYFYEQTSTNFTICDAIESYGVPTELVALKCIDGKKFYP